MITPTFNLDYKKSKAPKTTITRDMNELTSKVGNVYEAVAIISKRANQISSSLKKELDAKKSAYGSTMTDKQYQEKLSELKKGIVNGEKIPTLTVIIRPLDTATYENMIAALDEMLICSIDKYVIDKIGPEDKELIEKAGVK